MITLPSNDPEVQVWGLSTVMLEVVLSERSPLVARSSSVAGISQMFRESLKRCSVCFPYILLLAMKTRNYINWCYNSTCLVFQSRADWAIRSETLQLVIGSWVTKYISQLDPRCEYRVDRQVLPVDIFLDLCGYSLRYVGELEQDFILARLMVLLRFKILERSRVLVTVS